MLIPRTRKNPRRAEEGADVGRADGIASRCPQGTSSSATAGVVVSKSTEKCEGPDDRRGRGDDP